MTDVYWLDYSAAQLSAQTILNAGYPGVLRYIDSPANFGGKHTTVAEYNDDINRGLEVEFVFESTINDAAGGYNAGVANAARALAGCNALKYDGFVYAANDKITVDIPTWDAYLDGFAHVLGVGRVGAYGFANAMDAARGHATKFWQSGSRSTLRAFVHVWQDNNWKGSVGGIAVDRNLIINDIKVGVDIMNQDQENVLREILTQLVGSGVVGQYPGYASLNNSATHLTVTDFIRYIDLNLLHTQSAVTSSNAKLDAVEAKLDALETQIVALTSPTPTQQSSVTVQQITDAVNQAVQQHINITGTVNVTGA